MGDIVSYQEEAGVASVVLDDGRANVLTMEAFTGLNRALDKAERDGAAVVLAGRRDRFSAGFDLTVLGSGGPAAPALLRAGFEFAHRLLAYPRAVVVACTGHAYAMGAFLLLSGDYRLGVAGAAHTITANEVAVGLTMPRAAVEVCRQRLTRAHFERAVVLAEAFTPESAVQAGFLDEVVGGDELLDAAHRRAAAATKLDQPALAGTKRRVRAGTLDALRRSIEADDHDFRALLA